MMKRIRSVVLCDEIRREDNGKQLYIGVYGPQVIARLKPAMLQFNVVFGVDLDNEHANVELRVGGGSVERFAAIEINGPEGYANLVVPITIALTEPRTLEVSLRNPADDWPEPYTWEITFGPDAVDAPPSEAEEIARIAEQIKAEANAGPIEPVKTIIQSVLAKE